MRRAFLSLLVRAALPAAALALGLRGVDWRAVTDAWRGARGGPLAAVVGVNALMMTLKALRLRWLLGGAAGWRCCLLAKLTASAMNNVIPFRGGDLARLWMLERHARISKTVAAAVAVVESLFELLALAAVALAGALAIGQRWALLTASVLVATAGGLIALARGLAGRAPADPVAGGCPRLWDRLRRLRARVQPGLGPLRQPGLIGRVLGASLASWTLEVLMVVLCARALHLSIGPAVSTLVLLAINVALVVPSAPAGAGAFEAAVVLVLTVTGTAKSPAVAFALLYHAVQVVPVVCAGALVVWRSGLTLNRLPPDRPRPRQPVTSAIARPSQPLTPTV